MPAQAAQGKPGIAPALRAHLVRPHPRERTGAISEGRTRRVLLQSRGFGAGLNHNRLCRVAVPHAGCGNRYGQQRARGIDHQAALAPLDLLAGVEAGVASRRGAAGAPRINDRSGRFGGSAQAITPLLAQPIMHRFEHTSCCPAAEGFAGRLPGKKGLGQQPPRATRAQRAATGVDHPAIRRRTWRAGTPRRPSRSNRSATSAHSTSVRSAFMPLTPSVRR